MKRILLALRLFFILIIIPAGISPDASAATELKIRRISLYFENRRPETTVQRNTADLKAFADIAFTGSGLLEGYWEVNGRVLSRVSQHLQGSGSITLQTPKDPPMPAFDPGTQIVKFIIVYPSTSLPVPSILYFVVPEGSPYNLLDIRVFSPRNGASVAYAPLKFTWERARETAHFLVGFYSRPGSKPLFSAYINDTEYLLPESVLRQLFRPGQKYYWKVICFDEKYNIICENDPQGFSFRK
ncbi:MAG: hypothetical protein HZA17_12895 [Nitrospirae bacterium]|nr:hypothetical protein [Nitrospirota bacterium]